MSLCWCPCIWYKVCLSQFYGIAYVGKDIFSFGWGVGCQLDRHFGFGGWGAQKIGLNMILLPLINSSTVYEWLLWFMKVLVRLWRFSCPKVLILRIRMELSWSWPCEAASTVLVVWDAEKTVPRPLSTSTSYPRVLVPAAMVPEPQDLKEISP
jgi:hypothetical protein